MARIALIMSYDGSCYHGFQRQKDVIGVQNILDKALSKVANSPVETFVSGRTDTNVHATNQVVHFDYSEIEKPRSLQAWVKGTNTHLPPSIKVKQAFEVDDDFHARFSATSRTYRYIILNSDEENPHLVGLATFVKEYLNQELMNQAANYLIGEHNFASFRASGCQSKHPNRKITHASVIRQGDMIIFEVSANAFLYHMVRNITAVLLEIGKGNQTVEYMKEIISYQDRAKAPATAKPDGLYLVKIDFAEYPEIRPRKIGPLFL